MGSFDISLVRFFNQAAGHSAFLDGFAGFLATSGLVKGAILFAVLCWIWFRSTGVPGKDRASVVATVTAALAAVLVARILAIMLPFRARPVFDPELGLTRPFYSFDVGLFGNLNAFPSDHAALFGALAVGILMVSRPAGVYAISHVCVFVLLPRLHLGLHYVGDIAAGLVIAIITVLASHRRPILGWIDRYFLPWGERHPGLFYGLAFLLTYQICTLFRDIRVFSIAIYRLLLS